MARTHEKLDFRGQPSQNLALQDNFSEMKNYLKKIGSNRRLTAGKLAIDFKNPWNYLAEMPTEARGEAPSEARQSVGILFKMSSDFFQQTPPNLSSENFL